MGITIRTRDILTIFQVIRFEFELQYRQYVFSRDSFDFPSYFRLFQSFAQGAFCRLVGGFTRSRRYPWMVVDLVSQIPSVSGLGFQGRTHTSICIKCAINDIGIKTHSSDCNPTTGRFSFIIGTPPIFGDHTGMKHVRVCGGSTHFDWRHLFKVKKELKSV